MANVISAFGRFAVMGAVTVLSVACGDPAPTVEDLKLDRKEVAPGETVKATYKVSDRDLGGGKAVRTLRVQDKELDEAEIPFGDDSKTVMGTSTFTVTKTTPKGTVITVEVQAFDSDGNASNVASAKLTVK